MPQRGACRTYQQLERVAPQAIVAAAERLRGHGARHAASAMGADRALKEEERRRLRRSATRIVLAETTNTFYWI